MPVPKRKTSKSRRDKRSANKGLKVRSVASCQTCQEPVAPHRVCNQCGYYKGVKVLRTKVDRIHDRTKVQQVREVTARARENVVASKEAAEETPSE